MSVAEAFLERLLDRAEGAEARGKLAQAKLLLSPAQCPDYFSMRSLQDADMFRAQLDVAQRKGAVKLHTNSRLKPPRDVEAVSVVDAQVLAAHLGRRLRSADVQDAAKALSTYQTAFPVISELLKAWRKGRSIRGRTPEPDIVQQVLDAVRVIQARSGQTRDVLMRRESIRLFQDSKRIEGVSTWLEILTSGQLDKTGLSRDDVFSALGLHREPVPWTMAADDAWVESRSVRTQVFRPYLSLPMAPIESLAFTRMPSYILTVENKQIFHEMALQAEGTGVCLILTSGMPSPAWHRIYALLLAAVPHDVPICHFGDLDVGGLRIAHDVSKTALTQGRRLQPWMMDPEALQAQGLTLYEASAAQAQTMSQWCLRIGWPHLAERMARLPGKLEQEALQWPLSAPVPIVH